jgi:two-component system cell cycle sensor histidine kinase/response regulator CckA
MAQPPKPSIGTVDGWPSLAAEARLPAFRSFSRTPLIGYGSALLLTPLAVLGGNFVGPWSADLSLVLAPVLAVLGIAWLAGCGPALATTAVGAISIIAGLHVLRDAGAVHPWAGMVESGFFILIGLASAVAARVLQGAEDRAALAQLETKERQQLLEKHVEQQRDDPVGDEFAAIIQHSEDAFIGMSLDETIRSWNPSAERLFGYRADEVLGQPIDLLIPTDFSQATPAVMQRIVQGEHIKHYETVRVRKDGTLLDVSLGLSPIKDAGGKVVGISTIAREISERKQAERRQAAQHGITKILGEAATLAEAAPKLLKVLCESLKYPVGIFWHAERQAGALTCLEIWHEPLPRIKELASLIREASHESGAGLPGRVWATGKPEWLGQAAPEDNSPRSALGADLGLCKACAFPVRLAHEVRGVIEFIPSEQAEAEPQLYAVMATVGSQIGQFIGRKQTEARLRHTEDQYRQAQKMEAIGRLAGGIAHDFNNLLTGILGYSDLLLSNLTASDPSFEEMTEIRKAAERAALLTRQLLAFSRKEVLAAKVLDLNSSIKDTEKMLHRLIGEDIQLTTSLAAELGKLKADPGQIEQVILNLAVNARDAMPKGGQLVLETADLEVDQTYTEAHPEVLPGKYVQLMVRDTGCGMDEGTKARLFEPFFTTKEFGKGTGLGLATVYGIVKHGGGHIEVESQPDRGTTFRIYFPRSEEVVALRKSHSGLHKAPSGQETVLLVEDEELVRILARKTLQKCGYNVVEASRAEEAIRLAEQHRGPIHLLISDVVMPGMGGGQLAERLLAFLPELRVLYMSGYTDDAMVRYGVMEEEVDFLQKPFTPVALAKKVREVLDVTDTN